MHGPRRIFNPCGSGFPAATIEAGSLSPTKEFFHFIVPVFAVSTAIDMTVESRHKFGLLAKAPSEGNRPPPTGDAMHPTTKGGCS
jgi:hypothetical protein